MPIILGEKNKASRNYEEIDRYNQKKSDYFPNFEENFRGSSVEKNEPPTKLVDWLKQEVCLQKRLLIISVIVNEFLLLIRPWIFILKSFVIIFSKLSTHKQREKHGSQLESRNDHKVVFFSEEIIFIPDQKHQKWVCSLFKVLKFVGL